jgi:hypothetical protein
MGEVHDLRERQGRALPEGVLSLDGTHRMFECVDGWTPDRIKQVSKELQAKSTPLRCKIKHRRRKVAKPWHPPHDGTWDVSDLALNMVAMMDDGSMLLCTRCGKLGVRSTFGA